MTFDDFIKKYEPNTFNDITMAEPFDKSALARYASRRNFGNVLLYGPNGSAKSTIARSIIKDRLRQLGLSETIMSNFEAERIESISKVVGEVSFQLMAGEDEPYVLIEEVDRLRKSMLEALTAFINDSKVGRFIFTTNHVHSLIPALIDRCESFQIHVPTPNQFLHRALAICASEGVTDSPTNLLTVMENSSVLKKNPSLRDILRSVYSRIDTLKSMQVSTNAASALVNQASMSPFVPPLSPMPLASNVLATSGTLALLPIALVAGTGGNSTP